MTYPINLFWWRGPAVNNFGNELSRIIVEHVANRTLVQSSLEECDLVAIGSVLNRFSQPKILSERRRVPNVWAQFGEIDQGRELKFKDYFTSVERPIPSKYHLTGNASEEDLGRFAVCADTGTVADVCDNLVKAFSGFSN